MSNVYEDFELLGCKDAKNKSKIQQSVKTLKLSDKKNTF